MIEKLEAGCYLLVIGMGTVFIFLTIMIYVMKLSSTIISIVNKYWPEEIPAEKAQTKNKSTDNGTEIALAIACALHERETKKC